MGSTAIHDRFLPALDGTDDLEEEPVLDEGGKVLEELFLDRLLYRSGDLRRSVLPGRSMVLLRFVVVADDASLPAAFGSPRREYTRPGAGTSPPLAR